MSKPDAVYYKILDEIIVTNERLNRIANALEGIFSVLAGNDELGLDGVLPVLQRVGKCLEPVGEYHQHLIDMKNLVVEEG